MTPADHEFDVRVRALLRALPVEDGPPIEPPRRRFLALVAGAGAVLAVLGAGGLGLAYADTPPLVRASLAHVREEAGLRGELAPLAPVRAALGLRAGASFPGTLQLCKSCIVAGLPAWHVSVFLDGLGYVQILAFRETVKLAASRGWWLGAHWQVLAPARRDVLVLFSHSAQALEKVARRLQT